jgi:magnesium-protoporphyrin O-methyltransferase
MNTASYIARRQQLTQYFDRTAASNWARLTSNEPVGRIRATVRAGRDQMRASMLSWLPDDLTGLRLLDAGCGTGAFAIEAALRGAKVTAIDVSPTLVDIAAKRTPPELHPHIDYSVGDMLSPEAENFDYIVAMDSLIHYVEQDMIQAISRFASLARRGVVFTFAPRTAALSAMHAVGRLFPRSSDRAPAIEPIAAERLQSGIRSCKELASWEISRTERVNSGFYISQAMELTAR